MKTEPRLRAPGYVLFVLAGAVVFLIALLMRAEQHLFGLFGPHEYWASQWATDYSNGFVNRGLLGEILRLLAIDNSDYLVLTILSWLVVAALYTVILDMLWRLTKALNFGIRMCLATALLLSPAVSGTLIETVGDPIQLLLLLHLILAQLLLGGRAPPLLVGIVYAAAGAFMVLVHEASIFFFVPWLGVQAFFVRKNPQAFAALIGAGVVSTAIVAFLVLRGFSSGGLENPVLHLGAQQFVYEGRLAPPFATLLGEESRRMFGSGVSGYLETALRLAGATLLPILFAGLVTLARIGTGPDSLKPWRWHALAFLAPAICLGPLMLVAHDWGRFFSYELILFLWTLTGLKAADHGEPQHGMSLVLPLAGSLVLSGLTTTDLLSEYRVNGLDANLHIFAAAILVIGLFGALTLLARKSFLRPEQTG